MLRARVIVLDNINNRRAGRSCSEGAPCNARQRMARRRPRTERSTAGATSGATRAGTPRRTARAHTSPKPSRKEADVSTHDHGDGAEGRCLFAARLVGLLVQLAPRTLAITTRKRGPRPCGRGPRCVCCGCVRTRACAGTAIFSSAGTPRPACRSAAGARRRSARFATSSAPAAARAAGDRRSGSSRRARSILPLCVSHPTGSSTTGSSARPRKAGKGTSSHRVSARGSAKAILGKRSNRMVRASCISSRASGAPRQ